MCDGLPTIIEECLRDSTSSRPGAGDLVDMMSNLVLDTTFDHSDDTSGTKYYTSLELQRFLNGFAIFGVCEYTTYKVDTNSYSYNYSDGV